MSFQKQGGKTTLSTAFIGTKLTPMKSEYYLDSQRNWDTVSGKRWCQDIFLNVYFEDPR